MLSSFEKKLISGVLFGFFALALIPIIAAAVGV